MELRDSSTIVMRFSYVLLAGKQLSEVYFKIHDSPGSDVF